MRGCQTRLFRKQRPHGLTIVELLVVIAILGVVAGLAVARLGKSNLAVRTQSFARQIVSAAREAHLLAVTTNTRTRLCVSGNGKQGWTERAPGPGPNPPATGWVAVSGLISATDSSIVGIANTASPGISGTMPAAVSCQAFKPDGTADPVTLFLQDINRKNRHKVVVYGTTSFVREISVESW